MSVLRFMAGVLVGGAVGAVLGVLYAPKSGEETREMIAETSKDLYDKAQDSVSELQEKANEVMSNLQEKGDELVEKIQNLVKKAEKAE